MTSAFHERINVAIDVHVDGVCPTRCESAADEREDHQCC